MLFTYYVISELQHIPARPHPLVAARNTAAHRAATAGSGVSGIRCCIYETVYLVVWGRPSEVVAKFAELRRGFHRQKYGSCVFIDLQNSTLHFRVFSGLFLPKSANIATRSFSLRRASANCHLVFSLRTSA
jgi:hypothetical protein